MIYGRFQSTPHPKTCLRGSRFHDRLVQQERYNSYVKNTTFVGPRPLIAACNDNLSEEIARHLQGTQFLIRLVSATHVERALEIDALEPRIDDKVYFIRSSLAFPRGVFGNRLYHADIYSVSASAKFAIYNILHEMRALHCVRSICRKLSLAFRNPVSSA